MEHNKLNKERLYKITEEEPDPYKKQRIKEISMKGTSSWLMAQPINAMGQYLCKADFQDIVRMIYSIRPQNLPNKYACGQTFSAAHYQDCHRAAILT